MIVETLRDRLCTEPFRPFTVRATSGVAYRVADPSLVVLMRSRIFIAQPRSDRSTTVPYLHIAAVEEDAGPSPRSPRGRRKG